MSSTKEEKIAAFWKNNLNPVSNALKDKKKKLLDKSRVGSSWINSSEESLELEKLSFDEVFEKLRKRFQDSGFDDLASQVPNLKKLAQELKPQEEDTDNEIDPYVYMMH
tara:strand:- start:71 stop:397 length:327 start_codon:yes stop_codon:yes gene_type:complete